MNELYDKERQMNGLRAIRERVFNRFLYTTLLMARLQVAIALIVISGMLSTPLSAQEKAKVEQFCACVYD